VSLVAILKKRRKTIISLLLAAITLVAFWPVRLNDFINYDDQQYVYDNPHVKQGLTWSNIRWAFTTGYASNWHPLTWLSHMVDVQFFGLKAGAHHLVNVGFHVLNAVLLFHLLARMTGSVWPSAFVASLFSVHPLHVESVAWAAERKDVLSAFFFLLTLWSWLNYVNSPTSRIRHPASGIQDQGSGITNSPGFWYLVALLCFALGLMCKPMLVTVPFVLLLLDFWPLKRFSFGAPALPHSNIPSPQHSAAPIRILLLEKTPFLLLSAASSLVTALVQEKAMVFYKALPLPYRFENAFIAYARYLWLMIWPKNLGIQYPHPGVWSPSVWIGALFLFIAITLIALLAARTRPYVTVGWLWFLGMLVPVIGLVQVGVQALADRYTYLPSIGIFIIVAWLGAAWAVRSPARLRPCAGVAACLIAICAWRTNVQARFWHDTETVFTHDLQVAPGSWVAHHNLALLALDRYQRSQRSAIETQALNANSPRGSFSVSNRADYLDQMISHCETALQLKPTLAEVRVTLAKALTEKGLLDDASGHLQIAIRADPKNAQAKQTWAEILHRQGRVAEAVSAYHATLDLEPNWEPVLNNLAWLLATHPDASVRNGREAVRLAERACDLTQRTNLWYFHTLAAAYAEAGEFTNAVVAAHKAGELSLASGKPELIAKAEARLRLYETHQPLRDAPK
jgi:tetratricopeptide (TPR) repeat protein